MRIRSVMSTNRFRLFSIAALIAVVSFASAACTSRTSAEEAAAAPPDPLAIAVSAVESRPIDRFIRVTGSLIADEEGKNMMERKRME